MAVSGADMVVRRALSLLLEGYGYRTGGVDEPLEGADLLLPAPRLDEGVREAFSSAPHGQERTSKGQACR